MYTDSRGLLLFSTRSCITFYTVPITLCNELECIIVYKNDVPIKG